MIGRVSQQFSLLIALGTLTVVNSAAQSRFQALPIDELRRAATAGDPQAQVELGKGYLKTRWGARDYKSANRWFQSAAEAGSADGQALLGNSYVRGLGVPVDVGKGSELIEAAVVAGSAVGIRLKGELIDQGVLQPHYAREAVDLYQIAANLNDPTACDLIALAFLRGKGRPRNLDQAASYFNKGAAFNNDDAILHLGQMYEAGRPFRDPVEPQKMNHGPKLQEALDAYVKGAQLGNRIAAYKAGMLLSRSGAASLDLPRATVFFEQSAQRQYGPARVALARILSEDESDTRNRSRALALYEVAEHQREPDAGVFAAELQKKLTPNEVAEAEKIRINMEAGDKQHAAVSELFK